jgi:hypothetical protein
MRKAAEQPVTGMQTKTSFGFSRIYAQGWNAGRQLWPKTKLEAAQDGSLNPYPAGPEHARWNEGFFGALG